MKRLMIAREASQDLAAISDYFLEKSVEAGERFVEKFGQKCQYLAQFPYLAGLTQKSLKPLKLRG